MAVIDINYDEGNEENLGYKSVQVSYGNNEKKIFNSGDFVKDWFDMTKYVITVLYKTESHFIHSSGVDHFIMDGAPYDSAYLHTVDGKAVLRYINRKKGSLDMDEMIANREIYEKGIEIFIEENTIPTWEELKERFKNE
jgi:hypothetical protein